MTARGTELFIQNVHAQGRVRLKQWQLRIAHWNLTTGAPAIGGLDNAFGMFPAIALPRSKTNSAYTLDGAIDRRRSSGGLDTSSIDVSILADLLFTSFGAREKVGHRYMRPYPSAGALYPVEIFFVVFNTGGIESGTYRYAPATHTAQLLRRKSAVELGNLGLRADDWEKPAAAIFFGCTLELVTKKYREAALRFAILEAGHACQNLCLTGTSRDITVRPWGAIAEVDFRQAFFLEPPDEIVLHAALVGR